METRCFKIKLEPNSIERVRAWAKTVNEPKTEALAVLRNEKVMLETVFLDQTGEGDFLISIMKAESFDKTGEFFQDFVHEIDRVYQNFKAESWESNKELELLVNLECGEQERR